MVTDVLTKRFQGLLIVTAMLLPGDCWMCEGGVADKVQSRLKFISRIRVNSHKHLVQLWH